MASKTKAPGAFLDEEEAVRVLLDAIEDGLARMHAISDRIIARRTPTDNDLRFLREMETALVNVADDVADRTVYAGPYGKLLEEAYRKGVRELSGVRISIDPEAVQTALYPSRLKIKDLLDEGSRSITELTARSLVSGWSDRELSRRIQSEVVLYAKDGTPYGVPKWRAELQARNEPMKVYRESGLQGYMGKEDQVFIMRGPDDDATNDDICSDYLGEQMTAAEWTEVGADIFGYGFHPN